MGKKFKYKYIKILIYIFLIVFIVCLLFSIEGIKKILSIVIFSFIISYALKPILKILVRKGISRQKSAMILILTLFILVIVNFTVVIPSIFKESLNLGDFLRELELYFNSFYQKMQGIQSNKAIYLILNRAYSIGNTFLIKLLDVFIEYIANIGESIIQVIIVPIITYYFLADGEYIENKLLLLCPIHTRQVIKKINRHIDKILGKYIISQFMLSILVGILTFMILCVFKIRFPLILSILNGIFNIIPYFGPIIGMIPSIIVALLDSPKVALYIATCLYAIQLIEGNIISPKITADSVSIHPLAVIIILLIGGELGGFIGMLIAVPISVAIKIIYEDLNYYLF